MSEHTPASRSTSGYAKKIEQLIEQRDSLRAVNAELLAALVSMKAKLRIDDPDGMYDMVCEAIARATAQADRALLENKS